ncbi:MAG: ROK family protein, partial [Catenulispora sp.]|nr:ROK family protein [Catenulispora sp.]
MPKDGRQRIIQDVASARRTALAVDVGGTKIAAAVVDADGSLLSRSECRTPATDHAEMVGDALLQTASAAIKQAELTPHVIGIGSAGPLDLAAGTVSPVNIPAWRGYPIVELLSREHPGHEVRLAGDGHCMALGEYWRRTHSMRTVLGMVVSTGVGGGVVVDGQVQTGPTGNAGHVGHMVVDVGGPACRCGGRGCVEAIASGPAMVRWAGENGWDAPDGAAAAVRATSARRGDP